MLDLSTTAAPRRETAWEFRLIYAASFAFFLAAGIVARALPSHWRPKPVGAAGGKSVFGEAKAAASIVVPLAFMG